MSRQFSFFTLICTVCSAAYAEQATFQRLGDLPGGPVMSRAWNISGDGSTVVGYSQIAEFDLPDFGFRAFRWSAVDGMINLGNLPGYPVSTALDVSFDGSTVIGYVNFGNDTNRAFRWTAAEGMVDLGTLGQHSIYNESVAYAVSDDGQIVVGSTTSPAGFQAFRWTATDGMVGIDELGGPNVDSRATAISGDGSTIVGRVRISNGVISKFEAFRWTTETGMVSIGTPPSSTQAEPQAVSADGSVLVGYQNNVAGTGMSGVFRWTEETGFEIIERPTADALSIWPHSISGDGSIVVGYYTDSSATVRPLIWDTERGSRDLRVELVNDYGLAELANSDLGFANGISTDGRSITGWGIGPGGHSEAWLVTLPSECMAGDMNDDGVVDLSDVPYFVDALLGAPMPAGFIDRSNFEPCGADGDGEDLALFVERILE